MQVFDLWEWKQNDMLAPPTTKDHIHLFAVHTGGSLDNQGSLCEVHNAGAIIKRNGDPLDLKRKEKRT